MSIERPSAPKVTEPQPSPSPQPLPLLPQPEPVWIPRSDPGLPVPRALVPMDAYRQNDIIYIHFDLPGVPIESIDMTVEQNVLTVHAERSSVESESAEMLVSERLSGTFSRQIFLGDTLDADRIQADYTAGVLTLSIPIREGAEPRKIEITSHEGQGMAPS